MSLILSVVWFFFSLFLQVLPGFCKANSPESGSQLVQLQSQKSSFQCSSITRVTSARNTQTNKERKKITTAFQQSPVWPEAFSHSWFFPLFLTKPRDPGSILKTETISGYKTRDDSQVQLYLFAFIAMITKWQMQTWKKSDSTASMCLRM